MSPQVKKERKLRVQKMNRVLQKLYPNVKIALNYTTPWECLVAVQLSAQCTDAMVNRVTEKLFVKYKTVHDYANAKPAAFEQDIFQTGFYRNKARNIIAAAKLVIEKYNGEIPETMEEMLAIPGVARKTANVVLTTLYGVSEGIAVDTHVRRFAIRFNLSDFKDPVRIERDLMEIMPKKDWWGFNHRLVHYGRDYCPARKHDCAEHPLTPIYPNANTIWPKAR